MENNPTGISYFVHRILAAILVVILVWVLWRIRSALLLGFAGILVAVFLTALARPLWRHTPLKRNPALTAVVAMLLAATVAFWWMLGPQVATQFDQLTQTLPRTFDDLTSELTRYTWGQAIVERIEASEQAIFGQIQMSRVTQLASSLLNAVLGFLVVVFIGLFVAFDPGLYRRGIVHLVPRIHHARAWEVLDALGHALSRWMLGRFIAIIFVTVVTTVGLLVLGVPLALILGLIAGIFDFVPWIGPLSASIPAILLALTVSPSTALYTALLYLIIQQLEGNLVTPLIQHREVSLPPALVLVALTAFGLLFGIMGVILAVPLMVVVMVLVAMLYVQDALEEPVKTPGQ